MLFESQNIPLRVCKYGFKFSFSQVASGAMELTLEDVDAVQLAWPQHCFWLAVLEADGIKIYGLGTGKVIGKGEKNILLTNFLVKSPTKSSISNHNFFLFQVTKMSCMIQLWIWNDYRLLNW